MKNKLDHKFCYNCCSLQCSDLEYQKGASLAGTITSLLVENRSSMYSLLEISSAHVLLCIAFVSRSNGVAQGKKGTF